jgi:hypothetical protein
LIQAGGDLLHTFATAEAEKVCQLHLLMTWNTMYLYCSGKIKSIKKWEEIVKENSAKISKLYNKNIQQEKLRLINERIKKHDKIIYDFKGRLLI